MGNHVGSSIGIGGGLALGAAAMYLLDPAQGRSRRARLRDKLVRLEHVSEGTAQAARRDLSNRTRGLLAELRARVQPGPVDDQILTERARSKIGRLVSHPHALHIQAHEGTLVLQGDILAHEVVPLVTRLRSVPGVREIDNQLKPHEHTFGVPALQGGHATSQLAQRRWPPSERLLAAAGGVLLVTRGIRMRGLIGILLDAIGSSLLLRGLTNLPARRWIQKSRGRCMARADEMA